jgi:hypothetical protein
MLLTWVPLVLRRPGGCIISAVVIVPWSTALSIAILLVLGTAVERSGIHHPLEIVIGYEIAAVKASQLPRRRSRRCLVTVVLVLRPDCPIIDIVAIVVTVVTIMMLFVFFSSVLAVLLTAFPSHFAPVVYAFLHHFTSLVQRIKQA